MAWGCCLISIEGKLMSDITNVERIRSSVKSLLAIEEEFAGTLETVLNEYEDQECHDPKCEKENCNQPKCKENQQFATWKQKIRWLKLIRVCIGVALALAIISRIISWGNDLSSSTQTISLNIANQNTKLDFGSNSISDTIISLPTGGLEISYKPKSLLSPNEEVKGYDIMLIFSKVSKNSMALLYGLQMVVIFLVLYERCV